MQVLGNRFVIYSTRVRYHELRGGGLTECGAVLYASWSTSMIHSTVPALHLAAP